MLQLWLPLQPFNCRRHIYVASNFQLEMSLLPVSLGLAFCTSRKNGTGGKEGGFQPGMATPNYWKLVYMWVWFDSQVCTRWLLWHLCEFRSFKTGVKWKCSAVINSLGFKFSSQGHFHFLQLLKVPQFLFCRVVGLKTAPRDNFSHP